MRRSSARLLASFAAIAALSACGGPGDRGSDHAPDRSPQPRGQPGASADSASSTARTSGPEVSPTAAPGVAFSYRNSFALEPDRIAQVQEQHAQACEALGVSRCRVTGMHYRRLNDRDIDATLELKLEPSLARRFTRLGLEQVEQAGGSLVESAITGTDVGTGIRADTRSIAQLNADLQRIGQQIADPAIPAAQKEGLRFQAEEIRQRIRDIEQSRSDQQETLASTPVTFEYGTQDYGNGPSFTRTLRQAGDGFVWGLYGLTVVLVTLAPWLVLGGLIWLLVRWFRRRNRRGHARVQEPPQAT